jgi:hypothetical protein
MNTPHEKSVSLRKFAAMTGTSDGGVRKAIAKGSIDNGLVDGKILPSVASIEWGKAILTEYQLTDTGDWITDAVVDDIGAVLSVTDHSSNQAAVAILPESADPALAPPSPASASAKAEQVEAEEVFADTDVYTGDEDVINDPNEAAEFLKDIPEGTNKIEAERLYSVFRARKAKRELQRIEGELVDKGLVYKNLFEFASVIRDNLKNIPDRVVDNILAAGTRNEAILILDNEIDQVLLSLSSLGEIKLTKET